jgi:phytoene/squalene synthetase
MATGSDKGSVSDEKAADTAEAYEQLTGQADKPVSDSDPVMDAVDATIAELDLPEPEEPAYINAEYENREQVEYVDVSGDDDSEDEKPAAKKTAAAKKS